MVVQFALSFGHFHAIAPAASSAAERGLALSKLSFAGTFAGPVADARSARQPASNHDPDERPGDICAICAVMVMASAALLSTPPALLLPPAIEFSHLTTRGEFPPVTSVRVAFQPRAPPIS